MSIFASLMRRADTLRRLESDYLNESWWTGYMRGLRRAHGSDFRLLKRQYSSSKKRRKR